MKTVMTFVPKFFPKSPLGQPHLDSVRLATQICKILLYTVLYPFYTFHKMYSLHKKTTPLPECLDTTITTETLSFLSKRISNNI